MPEEKAVTYHYRVLRRPRVVAFSHANLHSLVQGDGGVGGGGGEGAEGRGHGEKAKMMYESNNASPISYERSEQEPRRP